MSYKIGNTVKIHTFKGDINNNGKHSLFHGDQIIHGDTFVTSDIGTIKDLAIERGVIHYLIELNTMRGIVRVVFEEDQIIHYINENIFQFSLI